MSLERTLSAPGKLFLAGEYAVLWTNSPSPPGERVGERGVSRVLAVGPRAHALVRPRSDRRVELVLEGGKLSGDATPLGVKWDRVPGQEFHFVARTVDLALRVAGRETEGFSIAFEPSPLVNGHKLGLGSSARAVVLAAEAARTGLGADFDTLKLALVAHAEAQGGKGSGGDVAASFAGGVVRYRKYDVGPLIAAANQETLRAALPESPAVDLLRVATPKLPMAYVFSGESASTTSLVKEVERTWSPERRATFVTESDAYGDALESALTRGDFPAAKEAAAALQALLVSLGPTRSEALERILSLAEALGCGGKQSGAGGGDGCIVFGPDVAALDAFLSACGARGLFAMKVAPEPGLRGEATRHALLASWLD
jgi:phosphomevalonate kinase